MTQNKEGTLKRFLKQREGTWIVNFGFERDPLVVYLFNCCFSNMLLSLLSKFGVL